MTPMKASCIEYLNEKYCVMDPSSLIHEASTYPLSALLRCKFCKSLHPHAGKQVQYRCTICRCFNDLPKDYIPLQITECPSVFLAQHEGVSTKLRILLVLEASMGEEMRDGLLCLGDILAGLGEVQLSCVMYDENVRVIDLREDGQVLIINQSSLQIVEDSFIATDSDILESLINHLSTKNTTKPLINGSKLLSQILPYLKHPTAVIWVGSFQQQTAYFPIKRSQLVQVYSFLKIPNSVNNMAFSNNLTLIAKDCQHTKLIVEGEAGKITEELHYALYQILSNLTVWHYKVQSSRERKYPPQVISRSNIILGTLRDAVIIRLGQQVEPEEGIQIRITFTWVQGSEQSPPSIITNTLCVNFQYPTSGNQFTEQHEKYLSLFQIMRKIPTRKQILEFNASKQIELDINLFLRDCSFLQRHQLAQNIGNPNCVFIVWPWVGFHKQKPKFIYYFSGYFSHKQNQQTLQQMLELCQMHYAKRDRILCSYYHHIIQDIEDSQQVGENEQQSDEEGQKLPKMFYKFRIQEQS